MDKNTIKTKKLLPFKMIQCKASKQEYYNCFTLGIMFSSSLNHFSRYPLLFSKKNIHMFIMFFVIFIFYTVLKIQNRVNYLYKSYWTVYHTNNTVVNSVDEFYQTRVNQ